ncbi:hypothetical protein VPNG_03416 [Cytospora leucostoma]|uniref:Zn(2)-C6 fungal-type domain-containing protein n=1 Tax=Cytospora leucostoma TaxID=1230097 RepID=A0A423XFV3_9PEZI|nr:hypothetical protein VPNG_03416 [Cytospora leucostoma]
MDQTLESKACRTCAKAKRKCGRQIPTCGRCQCRGIRCDYPAAKQSPTLPPNDEDEVRLAGGEQLVFGAASPVPIPDVALDASLLDTNRIFDLSGGDDAMQFDELFPLNSGFSFPSSAINFNPKDSVPALPWYLEFGTWELDQLHDEDYERPYYCSSVLNKTIDDAQAWLATWVKTGACPFIHSRIYTYQIPRCIQDAYTALSTYQNRTPENKVIIQALIEERVKQLLGSQPKPNPRAEDDCPMSDDSALTPFEHLARVHALLVYQMIGLYDGDIRLRHVAEAQIPTLNGWLRQLIQSAKSATIHGPENFISSLVDPPNKGEMGPNASHFTTKTSSETEVMFTTTTAFRLGPEDTAWYAWLFAETIRRTWLVACTVQTIYLTLQVRWAPCPGGLPFTVREGLWSAGSAFAWATRCRESEKQEGIGIDFIRRQQAHLVFEQRSPEDLDEFSRCLFEITFGIERMERWRAAMGAKG